MNFKPIVDARLARYNTPPEKRERPGGGKSVAAHVNLDALIPREDFEVVGEGIATTRKSSIQISDLERTAFFYGALRKPDFQRETEEWNPDRVVGLIRTFIEDDLIPGVILWQNKELLFVIDGSHRLSALIAWVHDDYGDGELSQHFFQYQIPAQQIGVAEKTRLVVEKEFGSYKSHKDSILNPAAFGPEIVNRARRFGSLSLSLQWVTGDWKKAEDSFIRINQQAAVITPAELELIQSRRKPNTIAARAIIRRGTGHQYWSLFDDTTQDAIRETGSEVNGLIFNPPLNYPLKNVDLPAGGAVYASTALRMVYDFVGLCVSTPSQDDDRDGKSTLEYLSRCRHVMQMLLSNHKSSIGLHPAVYFYSWTGKQQPVLFLTIARLLIDLERANKLQKFTSARGKFEDFLIANRSLLNQLIRKFGTESSGQKHLREFYDDVLEIIYANPTIDPSSISDSLMAMPQYGYFQPAEVPYGEGAPPNFSTQVKSGMVLRDFLPSAPRCGICNGFIPTQAICVDHIVRKEDGGLSVPDNGQITHPYCNTGYKEWLVSQAKKKANPQPGK